VLVDRNYGEGLQSKPEYGLNLSRKGIATLHKFRFAETVENTLMSEGAQPAMIPEQPVATEGVG
jgi:hypothetical protein